MIKKSRTELYAFLEDNKEKIIKMYQVDGIPGAAIDRELGIGSGMTLTSLRKWGVPVQTERDNRKYKFNENFFDDIDTEEKAYFLGMLFGDGFNNQKAGFVVIGLKEEDKEILEKLSVVIESNRPLAGYLHKSRLGFNDCMTYRLTLSSRYVCERLAELGCMQAKTFKVEWPEYLKPELHRHFIRGVMDSDGVICAPTFGIIGTEKFCERLKEIIEKECDVTGHISRASYRAVNNIRNFRVGGLLQMRRVLDWLYKDATIYMERKFQKYQGILRWRPIPPRSKCFNPDGSLMNEKERYELMVERDLSCGIIPPKYEIVQKRRERANSRYKKISEEEKVNPELREKNLKSRRDYSASYRDSKKSEQSLDFNQGETSPEN